MSETLHFENVQEIRAAQGNRQINNYLAVLLTEKLVSDDGDQQIPWVELRWEGMNKFETNQHSASICTPSGCSTFRGGNEWPPDIRISGPLI